MIRGLDLIRFGGDAFSPPAPTDVSRLFTEDVASPPKSLGYCKPLKSDCATNSAGLTGGCAHQTIKTLSKLHHGSTDNSPSSQQLEVFVDLVEREDFEGVANLAVRSKRHDFCQVDVAAPERTVEGLFARNPREKRDVNAVADQ